ncbi:MAG: hypothetical protein LBE12_10245 [Planctomycetaceae bacterium]|jgi:hypothetical protein|nr:hypothetical protein [Planctomycetaceae bacterium]
MKRIKISTVVAIFSICCFCLSPTIPVLHGEFYCDKECELVRTQTITSGGYDSVHNTCTNEIKRYPYGFCTKEDKGGMCSTWETVTERTSYYDWTKENAYSSVSCILWVTSFIGNNVALVASCATCYSGVGAALTLGTACVGCIGSLAADGGFLLAFESACKKNVCKYKNKIEVTDRQVVCK